MMPRQGDTLLQEPDDQPRYRLRRADKIIAIVLLLGIVSLFLWPFVFFVIRPGKVGVLFHLFTIGTETEFVYHEGLGVKMPWNRIYLYDVRSQARDETVHALSTDGLTIEIAATVLFRPVPDRLGRLHKEIGPDYVMRVVRPATAEAIRDVVGKSSPHDLYKTDVRMLEQRILKRLADGPTDLIEYQGVTIRDLKLPDALNAAITLKLSEQQRADAYQYIVLQTQREAERKRIEAIGIQTFYSIVADALSPQLLTWRGIEATVEIAKSNNSKVIIVGGGKDQLPLILGSDIAAQPNVPRPTPTDPQRHPLPNFEELPKLFPDVKNPPDGAGTEGKVDDARPPTQARTATGAPL